MALSVLIIAMTAMGSLIGALSFLAPPAAAQTCDQPGPVISGDWTITTAQVCSGIVYTVDGNIAVNGPNGALTIRDGGLKFTEDTTHTYSLSVGAGGNLVLDNSIVTTEPRSIDAYLKLGLSVNGANARFTMQNGATLKFPGTFSSGAGAVISIKHSTITGFARTDVEPWVDGSWDDNDDAPTITWASSTITVFDSTISKLYERIGSGAPDPRMILTLSGSTTLTAINSYIGVDFNDNVNEVHNEIRAQDSSRAFLVGVTIDEAGSGSPANWIPAYVPVVGGSGTFYLYRWLDAFVTDSSGVPVNLAGVWSQMSPFIQTAFYPDNTNAFCPGVTILSYFTGKNCGNFNQTGADGRALIPLFTDQINTTTFPNAESFGNFEVTARSSTFSASTGVFYDAYPIINAASNTRSVTLALSGLTLPRPDLLATGATWNSAHGVTPLEGDDVFVSVTVRNQDPTGGAGTFLVRFLDGSIFLADKTAGPLGPNTQTVIPVTIPAAAGGTHSLRVIVDVTDVVPETNEGNNAATFAIPVTPIGPDLTVVVSFSPNPGFAENTVHVQATVVNNGGANASNFLVEFKQGTLASDPYSSVTVEAVAAGSSTIVSVDWIPSTPGTYAWCAVVDPDNRIPEPAPYREDDNSACANLPVNPAPNLRVFSQDLRTSDPYPFEGDSVTLQATVRNTGQATTGVASAVDFYMDDVFLQRVAVPVLAVGASSLVATTTTWAASPCGFHTIRAQVDPANTVPEGSIYESDNSVTSSVQVYPAGFVTWSFSTTVTGSIIPVAGSIEVTGSVTIVNGGIYVSQQAEACNRGIIKVLGAGRLILINSTVDSNWPLTIYVADTARLTTSGGSALNLDTVQGPGTLRSTLNAVLQITDTTVDAEVLASGASATFKRTSFQGSTLYINTALQSNLWDADMGSVTSLQLRSDDGNSGTVDFDIRNTTFDAVLTPQLHFGGHQWAQLTSVSTTRAAGTDWWTGMLSQSAKVTRYWWLRVEDVDGTGTLLEGAAARITVRRLDPTTLSYVTVLNPGPDDIYMTPSTTWPANAPLGFIVYRASAEDRFVSPSSQWANATYKAESSATINSILYYPDANLSAFVQSDWTIRLVFSALTPEMSIARVLPYYEANQTSVLPLNRQLNLTAVANNTGSISVRNVVVSFFATNVDVNNDGIMDAPKISYIGAGLWIGDFTIALLPLRSTGLAWVPWMPTGVAETTRALSVVIDAPVNNVNDPGAFRELNERNNTRTISVLLHVWPDLNVGSSDIAFLPGATPIEGNAITVEVTVHNDGTNDATGCYIVLTDDGGVFRSPQIQFSLPKGQTTKLPVSWTPALSGNHTIYVGAYTPRFVPNIDPRVLDHNWQNNWAVFPVQVRTKPDVVLNAADFSRPLTGTRGVPFTMAVIVHNAGDTPATGFAVSVYLDGNVTAGPLGMNDSVVVGGRTQATVDVRVTVNAVGLHSLTVFADSGNAIVETSELNNWANESITLSAPSGDIVINELSSLPYAPGVTLLVQGFINDRASGTGLSGLPVNVELDNPAGTNVSSTTTTTGPGGAWSVGLGVPGGSADGTYTIRVTTPGSTTIPEATRTIGVRNPTQFWNFVLLGLPVWVWLLIIIAAVVIIVGVTLYFRVYGLGKMVECGECGSFIPEDSTTCPKCGVEFEKDMAKCSNCQAWIPVDVKQCPECGVEFATGKVEMADYQEKMRMQYDEVVAKFREESQRTLGRALTEREFQDWWRKQPTFVTFEDWLREEEEMRKMGSKPCPACGTLNSVTATVCHKCGTYLKEEKKPPTGGAPPRPAEAPAGPGPEAAAGPTEPVPKKVIRKPVAAPPVIQKKVIKKPMGEQQQEGGGDTDTQNPPEDEF